MGINDLTLAKNLTRHVQAACIGLEGGKAAILEQVNPITAELLRWWFQQDYVDMRVFNLWGSDSPKLASLALEVLVSGS